MNRHFEKNLSGQDGYLISGAKNPKFRAFLEFLVPILRPTRPTCMPINIAAACYESLFEIQKVDWAKVFHEKVGPYTNNPSHESGKGLSQGIFYLHAYKHYGLLTKEELQKYKLVKMSWKRYIAETPEGSARRLESMKRGGMGGPRKATPAKSTPLPSGKKLF